MQFENIEAAESAIDRAGVALLRTREKAAGLTAEIAAALAVQGELVARTASGNEPPESEWDESETKLARLGRLAARTAAVLQLQARIIEAVKGAATAPEILQ
jgi:hypothetical protein